MKKIIFIILLIIFSVNSYALYVHERMYEGQTKLYSSSKGFYVVKLLSVSDAKKTAYFMVNNELSNGLDEDNNYNYVFKDKSEIIVEDILISEIGEPKQDSVDFYFYGSMNNPYPIEELSKYIKENVTEEVIEKGNKTEELKNITIIKDGKEKEIVKEEIIKEEKNILKIIIDFFKNLFKI